jgi:integrase
MASLTLLTEGRARVSWYDSRGIRRRRVLPKRQAQELYNQVCASRIFDNTSAGQMLKSSTSSEITFREIALKYRDEHLANTRAADNSYYVNILIHKWGEYRIHQLQTNDFRKWVRLALDNEITVPDKSEWKLYQLKASSIEKLIQYTMAILNYACTEGLISHNPISKIKNNELRKEFRRKNTFKPVALSTTEFYELIKTWPDHVRYPAIACFYSGIRASELEILTWSRVNRDLHRFEYSADDVKEADAKNVYYDPEVVSILESCYIDYVVKGFTDDQVFHSKNGGLITKDSFGRAVREWSDRAAIRDSNPKFKQVTPHTFRRSYRTRKDMEGTDQKSVMANMGHSSLAMSERYNVMDDSRMSSVAGVSCNTNNEEVNDILKNLVETGTKKGLSLTQIQSEIRRLYAARVSS